MVLGLALCALSEGHYPVVCCYCVLQNLPILLLGGSQLLLSDNHGDSSRTTDRLVVKGVTVTAPLLQVPFKKQNRFVLRHVMCKYSLNDIFLNCYYSNQRYLIVNNTEVEAVWMWVF